MAHYRLYLMDRFSGHIERFQLIESADDAGAIMQAEEILPQSCKELWCRHRKVKRWECNGRTPT